MRRTAAWIATLVIGAGFVAAAPTSAQERDTTLLVQSVVCPIEYQGSDFANDCDPTGDIGVSVTLDASEFGVSGVTDENGEVLFTDLGTGAYTITLDVPGDFANFVTFCTVPGAFEPLQLRNPNTNQIGLDLPGGMDTTCVFYVIGEDAKGDVDELPNTGVGATSAPSLPIWLFGSLATLALTAGILARRRLI